MRLDINFRDLGGYVTKDGRVILNHQFYRTGGLYRMNQVELDWLNTLHIQTILDLRTKEECEKQPDPLIPHAKMLQHSGVVSTGGEEIDFSPKGMMKTGIHGQQQLAKLKEYYANMPFGNEAFQVMFAAIIQHQVPLCFHCASGKDRTGVAAMLILLLLNCSQRVIENDYILTNTYRDALLSKHLNQSSLPLERKHLLEMMHGVRKEICQIVLQEIQKRYGSYEQYFLKEFGIDQVLRKQLIEYYTRPIE